MYGSIRWRINFREISLGRRKELGPSAMDQVRNGPSALWNSRNWKTTPLKNLIRIFKQIFTQTMFYLYTFKLETQLETLMTTFLGIFECQNASNNKTGQLLIGIGNY